MTANTLNIEQLRARYLRSLADRVAGLKLALDAKRYDEIRAGAHQLRGSGRSYGFTAVSEIAADIEQACDDGQTTLIRSHLAALEAEFISLRGALPGAQ